MLYEVITVLLGRTDLATNPFIQPVAKALNRMMEMDGEGMILNEKGQIIYDPSNSQLMTQYQGSQSVELV